MGLSELDSGLGLLLSEHRHQNSKTSQGPSGKTKGGNDGANNANIDGLRVEVQV